MFSHKPGTLLAVGLFCTVYGIILIKKGIDGDTLMPGTSFTYLPKWLFIASGVLMQLPIVGAAIFLKHIGYF